MTSNGMANRTGTPVKSAASRNPRNLALDAGLFELPGNEPLWIWVHTCPDRQCDCREALVLVTSESRSALLERALPVREAWQAGTGYAAAAAQHEEFTPFFLNIDAVTIAGMDGQQIPFSDAPPVIAEVLRRLDGEALDAIAMLWYLGKGYPDQREMTLAAQSVKVPHWRPGVLVAYDDVFQWVRGDLYFLDDDATIAFEAEEAYCINPGCACSDVSVIFYRLEAPGESQFVGMVEGNLSGTINLKPEPGEEETLAGLWAAFRRRHPDYPARFTRRDADMKCIGAKAEQLNARPKIGRNDPCSCGSGKKYKKCCAAAAQ